MGPKSSNGLVQMARKDHLCIRCLSGSKAKHSEKLRQILSHYLPGGREPNNLLDEMRLLGPEKFFELRFFRADLIARNHRLLLPCDVDQFSLEFIAGVWGFEQDCKGLKDYLMDYWAHNEWGALNNRIKKICSSRFKNRARIFKAVLALLKNKDADVYEKFAIAIPTLISQIDGMINDSFGIDRAKRGCPPKEEVEKLFLPCELDNMFQNSAIECIRDYLLIKGGKNNDDEDNFISRHKILHGEKLDYMTSQNILLLMGMIDALLVRERIFCCH